MNSAQVYPVEKSDKISIHIEHFPATDSVATEFQCDNLLEIEQLVLAAQKACLALSYLSCVKLFAITFKAIIQHIKQRLQMAFCQSV